MVKIRIGHSLVAIKNKLFVMGNRTYEIYDEFTKNFTLINVPLKYTGIYFSVEAISIGNKIAILRGCKSKILFLDTINDKWCEKVIDCSDRKGYSNIVKVPQK